MTPEEKLNIINRLNALEFQQKKNLDEIGALKKVLDENPKLLEDWMDLKEVSGYYIDSFSKVEVYDDRPTSDENKNVFSTENQAKSALAKAQLTQLLNSFCSGWDKSKTNYCIFLEIVNDEMIPYFGISMLPQFLAFSSLDKAKQFYKVHYELIHEYWSEFLV